MGWSIDLIKPTLSRIFDKAGINWMIDLPDRMLPTVYLHTSEEIPSATKLAITKLFPDNVHIWFNVMSIPTQGDLGGNTS